MTLPMAGYFLLLNKRLIMQYFFTVFVDRRLIGEIDVNIIERIPVFSLYPKLANTISYRITVYGIYPLVGVCVCFIVISVQIYHLRVCISRVQSSGCLWIRDQRIRFLQSYSDAGIIQKINLQTACSIIIKVIFGLIGIIWLSFAVIIAGCLQFCQNVLLAFRK